MITTVTVQKESATESNLSLIKRFNRRLQGAGVLRRLKASRWRARPLSPYKKKQRALKRLARRGELEQLRKWGLVDEIRPKKS